MLSNPNYEGKSYFDELESCDEMRERYIEIDEKNGLDDYVYYCEPEEVE